MTVAIYTDSTRLFTDEFIERNGNLCYVDISDFYLEKFFEDEILSSFRPDVDEGVSIKGLFEEWLDEYTADDTTELWEWCNRYGVECYIDSFFIIGKGGN